MKTFLTLLAAITSLSAYTLECVHAEVVCAICPDTMGGGFGHGECFIGGVGTRCEWSLPSEQVPKEWGNHLLLLLQLERSPHRFAFKFESLMHKESADGQFL
ncbi:hypothetical protein BDN67DRAFT_983246 [Paxillus ammoniavirescens]|nr:hypothetical protein BDN67DRAFT_983246 [Paxillus ammoniavirescens]